LLLLLCIFYNNRFEGKIDKGRILYVKSTFEKISTKAKKCSNLLAKNRILEQEVKNQKIKIISLQQRINNSEKKLRTMKNEFEEMLSIM
jgi:hypothetical protein